MEIKQVKKLIRQKEGLHLEFKSGRDGVGNSFYESVCAFMNTEGGDIFVGVNDKGIVDGVDPASLEKTGTEIITTLSNSNKIDPAVSLEPVRYELNGKSILHLSVPESSRVHKLKGVVYARRGESDLKLASQDEISKIYIKKQNYYAETKVYKDIKYKQLDGKTIAKARNYIASGKPGHPWLAYKNEEFLEKAELYKNSGRSADKGPTLAAILLFGKTETIRSIMPQYKVDCLVKRINVDRYDDRLEIKQNLIETYLLMMGFVERYLPDPFYMEGYTRLSLREKIFREIAGNLLVHRDYTSAFPAELIIYKDRVEATNPCIPRRKGPITLASHYHVQKNPLISGFFQQLGWADEIGSGIVNVNRYLPKYDTKGKAEFFEDEIFKTVISLGGTPQATPQAREEERTNAILEYCREARSMSEIQKQLKIKDRKYFRREIIAPLVKNKILELTIPDKPNSPNQKYRATTHGKALLENK